jgi:hypothetical protein
MDEATSEDSKKGNGVKNLTGAQTCLRFLYFCKIDKHFFGIYL